VSILPAQHPAGKPPHGALTAGSLCSGYGGLDLAVIAVTGARLAWVAETDRYAAGVLARQWPDVSNLGDVTALDWAQVPPVDLVSAGWPCQDISYAGPGAGITEGTRSGLWLTIADGLRRLRPSYVFLENVAALRTRGLEKVLGDLAALVSAFLPCLGCRGAVRRHVLVACGDAGRGCTFAGHDLVQFLPARLGIVGCGDLPGDPRGDAGADR